EHLFSLPLSKVSSSALIDEVRVDERVYPIWRDKFLRSLAQAYARAPYRDLVLELVKTTLFIDTDRIGSIASDSLRRVLEYLGLTTDIVPTSRQYGNAHLSSQERVLDICRMEGAGQYINAQGGKHLYSKDSFKAFEIELSFIRPQLDPYPQFGEAFIPGLSIIDVLMFNSEGTIRTMLETYTLD
ncbi:MAG: WbqC family protein, partial [Candidatus Omnitrophica bacterium]|nr:WbqC family protein [Candidatus Omnitrophota bacterium]